MADFIKTQNSFANGEVAPEFYVRDGINGVSCLENMDVLASGALSRRSGLVSVERLRGPAKIINFSVSDTEQCIIALTDTSMFIYHNDVCVFETKTPWSYEDLSAVQYAQRFGTMIFVHPDHKPRVLQKTNDRFTLSEFYFDKDDATQTVNLPFMQFDDASGVKITISAHSLGNNYATFTTNTAFWTPDSVGSRLYLLDNQWLITEYISSTQVVVYINTGYTMPNNSVSLWYESAFSNRRGWPRSITFHQDRLVFGGSRSWPSGIWMSKVGQHRNFNSGSGLDDEAIFVSLLSQERQEICTVVSSDNLQILTNCGEWAISNKPLTPTSVDIKQHTSVGSMTGRYLQPQKIEGTTVFVSGNGRDIRELCLDEIGENYNANDLCALSKHLINMPLDMAYNSNTRQLFVVRTDGVMAVLNQNAALGISAWARYTTNGKFISVATCNGRTYVVVQRDDRVFLEYFDSSALTDSGEYNFSFRVSGLPLTASKHNASRIKVRKVSARLLNTKTISINSHRIALPNEIYDVSSAGYNGDVHINLLGTLKNTIEPMWTIHGDDPLPITVLSVSVHGWYTI
ncbi:MAG: hypothetical protein J6J82_01620 [Alphaproteobacteria bacterium]|nr:hypothetical protein [Alphaproteobacteria bacterium]